MVLTYALLASEAGLTDIQSPSKLYMAMQLALRPLASAGKPREASSWELLPMSEVPRMK